MSSVINKLMCIVDTSDSSDTPDSSVINDNPIELIYKYSYGSEDLLGACIKIFKYQQNNDIYTIEACFNTFYEIAIPIIKSNYVIMKYKEETSIDEIQMITKNINITILAHCNPPPEKLFYIG
jgi:hypothetical protein